MTNVFDKVRFSHGLNSETGEVEWKLEPDDTPRALTPLHRKVGPHVIMNREELQQLNDAIASDLREHEA